MSSRTYECGREDAEAFAKLVQEAEGLLKSGQYDREKRDEFIVGATGILAPSLLPVKEARGLNELMQQRP